MRQPESPVRSEARKYNSNTFCKPHRPQTCQNKAIANVRAVKVLRKPLAAPDSPSKFQEDDAGWSNRRGQTACRWISCIMFKYSNMGCPLMKQRSQATGSV